MFTITAGIKSSDLRDGYAQKKYRNQSKSTNKKDQDVAHYFSLDIAVFMHKFVHPLIPVIQLKNRCNDRKNFRMINKTINKSTHKQIDNKLMNSFENIMLPKFETNQRYKTLLQRNPCKLELEMAENEITCVTLKANEASRARAQTKRIQQLNFPNHYTAFVRLFYRCFKDSKERYIWDDRRNTKEFKQYLKTQLATQINDDKMIGIDDKGRKLYQGKKGGTYYKASSGRKTYVKNKQSVSNSNDDEKMDARKKIVNDVCKQKVKHNVSNKSEDKIIGKDNKGRVLYEGSKGGKYYKTASGKKRYVKVLKGDNNDRSDNTDSSDNVYGTDNKGRTLYKGRKGGTYYMTPSGKKSYVKTK